MINNNQVFDPREYAQRSYSVGQNTLIYRVFLWMSIGLVLSGAIAFFMASVPNASRYFLSNPWLVYGSLLLQLALVIAIGAGLRSQKISSSAMVVFFFVYSALMGVSLSGIFLMYTANSIYGVFFISSATFLAMAFYGYTTKADLTQLGSLLVMGLFGIIIASVVNLFLHNNSLNIIISFLGVLIFVGLTAFDAQKIKALGQALPEGSEEYRKASIMGALTLYLDFINLFLFLLRLMGNRQE